jgi:peptidoglycan/LPS O-acetylase OafA/YrhL
MEQRSKTIDILRALAVFLVFGRHMPICPVEVSPFFHQLSEIWFRGGWVGVDLFFVLSGFLVSGLLFREHEKFGYISAKNFLVRRGFKIYPAFWLLILTTIAVLAFRDHAFHPQRIWSELLFLQNYRRGLWNHTWSLAVEEHFYFLLLLFLLLLSRRCPTAKAFRLVPPAFAILAITCLSLRVLTAHLASYTDTTHLFPSHLRMDSLFAGVFISYLYHFHQDLLLSWARRYRVTLVVLGALLLCLPFFFSLGSSQFIVTFGLTLLYVGSGFILIAALVIPALGRAAAAVAFVGSHSYSIYLWHRPFVQWAVPKLDRVVGGGQNWFFDTGAYLIGSISFGILMAMLIEFPVLGVRDHLFPSRGRPLTVTKPQEADKNLPPATNQDDTIPPEKPRAVELSCAAPAIPARVILRVAARDPESNG